MTGFRIRQLHRFGTCLYLINKKNKKKCVIYLFVANNYLSLHMK